jgi:hypothetical protein
MAEAAASNPAQWAFKSPSRTKKSAPFAKRPKASVLHTDIPGFKSSTEHHHSHVSRKSDGGGR